MTIIRIGCDFEPFASLQSFGSFRTMENVFIERKGISKKGKKSAPIDILTHNFRKN